MLTLLLDDRLYLAPIDEKACRKVLDVGCGTGIWSLDFADAHPSAEGEFVQIQRPYACNIGLKFLFSNQNTACNPQASAVRD
jgi:methylase of polypeptide subunit release factors